MRISCSCCKKSYATWKTPLLIHLRFSIDRTQNLLNQQDWQPEELERLESLASRFARLSDLLMQRVMRLVDDLELTATGTLLDRIHRAEKRGWVPVDVLTPKSLPDNYREQILAEAELV